MQSATEMKTGGLKPGSVDPPPILSLHYIVKSHSTSNMTLALMSCLELLLYSSCFSFSAWPGSFIDSRSFLCRSNLEVGCFQAVTLWPVRSPDCAVFGSLERANTTSLFILLKCGSLR